MIRIAVCDDEPLELNASCLLLSQYTENHPGLFLSVSRYQSSRELCEVLERGGKFDIYILDIIMDGMDGIKTGEQIRGLDADAFLIYLTSSPDYALMSFSVWAFSYLLKPVNYEKLAACLDRAIRRKLEEEQLCFPVKTSAALVSIPFASLIYVEYRAHYLYFHVADGRIVKSTALSVPFAAAMAPLLEDPRFVKTGSSFVLNMRYASSLDRKGFSLVPGGFIPVSRPLYKEVRSKYLHYILGNENQSPPPCDTI